MVPVDFNESFALILLDVLVLVSIASLPAAAFSVLIYMNHHGLFIVYFKGWHIVNVELIKPWQVVADLQG